MRDKTPGQILGDLFRSGCVLLTNHLLPATYQTQGDSSCSCSVSEKLVHPVIETCRKDAVAIFRREILLEEGWRGSRRLERVASSSRHRRGGRSHVITICRRIPEIYFCIILHIACMAGHAHAGFNHLNTLEPIKNVRSVDKIF